MADDQLNSRDIAQTLMASQRVSEAVGVDDWMAAHQAVQALLSDPPGDVSLHHYEQIAALEMLRHHLLSGPADDIQLDATSLYVNLLIENRSPQADRIADALARLSGHWTDAQIRDAARIASQAAEMHLATTLGCEGCRDAELRKAIGEDTYGQEVRLLAAIDRLQFMSR